MLTIHKSIVPKNSFSRYCSFSIKKLRPTLYYAILTVDRKEVNRLFSLACNFQKKKSATKGFSKKETPLKYISENFHTTIKDHLKEFLFNYFITNHLFEKLYEEKISFAGEPRLVDINLEHDQDAKFTFELTISPKISLFDWKHLPFKAPKRKQYKDLDKQVENFYKTEKEHTKKFTPKLTHAGDWICFESILVDHDGQAYFEDYSVPLWLKIGCEEADQILHEGFKDIYLNKSFITNNNILQDHFSPQLNNSYNFKICIKDFTQHNAFDFELLKKHFKIKNNKDMSKKLIEVFSYRNNLSQRRTTAEETLQLMLNKHKFDAPNHLVIRQERILLNTIQQNPDYYVYRTQKDFNHYVKKLAEKQSKEMILLDYIAFNENILPQREDIKSYLNLSQRSRTKEFLYFDLIETQINGREMPLSEHMLRRICSREKTLNHIINHLTKH